MADNLPCLPFHFRIYDDVDGKIYIYILNAFDNDDARGVRDRRDDHDDLDFLGFRHQGS